MCVWGEGGVGGFLRHQFELYPVQDFSMFICLKRISLPPKQLSKDLYKPGSKGFLPLSVTRRLVDLVEV